MLFINGENLEGKTNKLMADFESILDTAFRSSGSSLVDILEDMDAEKGAMIGGCIRAYKSYKESEVAKARAIDEILNNFNTLKRMNDALNEQNEIMRRMLRDLSNRIEMMEKKD